MNSLNLKLEQGLLNRMDKAVKENDYSTRTEFIRESIRKNLTELEKQRFVQRLTEMKGSLRGKGKINDKEAGELAFNELAKEFGVDLE